MRFYEVYIADGHYRSSVPLTYSSEQELRPLSVVNVELRKRTVSGFVLTEVDKPNFATKPIKSLLSEKSLPPHTLELAEWLENYYASSFGEALRQFAPSKAAAKPAAEPYLPDSSVLQLELDHPLSPDQRQALQKIRANPSTTVLLHGDTGTGKTRVYLELAQEVIKNGRSVMILTPEIALTPQLASAAKQKLNSPVHVIHSQLTPAKRKVIWRSILEAVEPVLIIGPRSALFSPVHNLGLIVVDEAHEPAYKQEQAPRYHANRVASQLGWLAGAKVILGTATPLLSDYYLANERQAVVKMSQLPGGVKPSLVSTQIIDLKKRQDFTKNYYLSNQLIDEIRTTLGAKQQVMVYLNRRGSARLIMCDKCGWQLLCPNCDIPLVYHADSHDARCHICGFSQGPPKNCPVCHSPDVIYKSAGTKAITDEVSRIFSEANVARFDTNNASGERLNDLYEDLRTGKIDILVGTQLLAKGLDLPKLALVGIINAETSLALPDFTAEERAFQLLYQIIGRVGRGHGDGKIVVQTYNPDNRILGAAIKRDWDGFYKEALEERQQFRFPPSSYLLKLVCRRVTVAGIESATEKLKAQLLAEKLPVEVVGPAPSFYARRGKYYYWQLVVKSKDRKHLLHLASLAPPDWRVDLDPFDLL